MINFFKEIEDKLKLPVFEIASGFKIIYLINGAYLEGHSGIFILEKNQISFKLKKGLISFFGENLCLSVLEKDSALIKGKIEKIEKEAPNA